MKQEPSDEDMKKLQEIAILFRKTAQEIGYDKVAVLWSVCGGKKFATGVTLSDDLKAEELGEMVFRLNGRAYNMIDFE